MEAVDTLIHARWVIPVEPAGTVLERYALAVRGGRIVDLLPSATASERFQPEVSVNLDEHVLIPGLVNAHTHAAMSLFRGLADDLPLMDWLTHHIWPAEGHWVNPEFVRDGTELAAAEMLRGGTTCFNDMYFFPDETARAAKETHIRAVVGLILIDFPTAWASGPDEYLHKGIAVRDEFRNEPLVRTAFAPHAPYTVSDAPLERVATLAEELDIPIHMHVHETAHEVGTAISAQGKRPLARLQALRLVSPRLMAVHMTQVDEADLTTMAESGAHVVHCPESNLKLASGFCPVQRLLDAGVNVALGTDGAASNNDLDLFGELRTAALLAKGVAEDATALSAPAALRMATLGGARALGLDEEIGSLVPGKAADAVAVRLGSVEHEPVYNPLSQLVYTNVRDRVSDVWVAGRHVVKEGALTTLDEKAVLEKARHWGRRIRESG